MVLPAGGAAQVFAFCCTQEQGAGGIVRTVH